MGKQIDTSNSESSLYTFCVSGLAIFVLLLPLLKTTRPLVLVKAVVSSNDPDSPRQISKLIRNPAVLDRAIRTANVPVDAQVVRSLQVRTLPSLEANHLQAEIQLQHHQPRDAVRLLDALLLQLESPAKVIGSRTDRDSAKSGSWPSMMLVDYQVSPPPRNQPPTQGTPDIGGVRLSQPTFDKVDSPITDASISDAPSTQQTERPETDTEPEYRTAQAVPRVDSPVNAGLERLQAELKAAQDQLEELEITFNANHPVIRSVQQEIESIQQKIQQAGGGSTTVVKSDAETTPNEISTDLLGRDSNESDSFDLAPPFGSDDLLSNDTDLLTGETEEPFADDSDFVPLPEQALNDTEMSLSSETNDYLEFSDSEGILPPVNNPLEKETTNLGPIAPSLETESTDLTDERSESSGVAVVRRPLVIWKEGPKLDKLQLLALMAVAIGFGLFVLRWKLRSSTKYVKDVLDVELVTEAKVLASLFPGQISSHVQTRPKAFRSVVRASELVLFTATMLVIYTSLTDRTFRDAFPLNPLAAYSQAFWQFWNL